VKWTHVIWDSMPGGNAEHVEEHGLTIQDVEYVLDNYVSAGCSQSSGNPCVFGYTPDDRFIIVIYEEVDEQTIFPVTAYDVPE
jgi:uncharacterized DUF497 family protein